MKYRRSTERVRRIGLTEFVGRGAGVGSLSLDGLRRPARGRRRQRRGLALVLPVGLEQHFLTVPAVKNDACYES